MVPKSLCVWFQRYGRAGRAGQPAIVILLVEPSVFKCRKKRRDKPQNMVPSVYEDRPDNGEDWEDLDEEEEDAGEGEGDDEDGEPRRSNGETAVTDKATDDMEYVKHVEDALRRWIEGEECRRQMGDKYFNNPLRDTGESSCWQVVYSLFCILL